MHPKELLISDFTYSLPQERIAGFPLPKRDESKLIHYRNGIITESIYRNLALFIPAGSLLIFNDTKVIEARLLFRKSAGSIIEIFCLEPHPQYKDITTAMAEKECVRWICLIGGASKWKKGQVLEKKITTQHVEITLQAKYIEKINEAFVIELSWKPVQLPFAEILHEMGSIPLPPYIKRAALKEDAERYQTIYAKTDGSVASPTAGLHFTPAIFSSLQEKKIIKEFVTLHVGAGTFKPIKENRVGLHIMHSEYIDIPVSAIKTILKNCTTGITCVGTTSLRTIESLYWLGVKTILFPAISTESLRVLQWDPYELPVVAISASEALESLLNWLKKNNKERLITTTQLLVAPGYPFKIVQGLITNFHQPNSTLLLLVAAFIGEEWKRIYKYALENNFRFLSYGDGCLLQRH